MTAAPSTLDEPHVISPQPGPQTEFLACEADIAVYGGAAGGGKTWALLLEPLRHANDSKFGGVIFRKTYKEVKNTGGLWDEAQEMYSKIQGVRFREQDLQVVFPSGAKLTFGHLQHEKNKYDWQGAQIGFAGFDELTHFTESQFFYLMSRMRSVYGVTPYIRATTNPDASSWVKSFLAPWVDTAWREEEAERAQAEGREPRLPGSGEILWMLRRGDEIVWLTHKEAQKYEEHEVKSVTFIFSSVYDNQILMENNPEYLSNLNALGLVDRARLLEGDWDVEEGDVLFDQDWFPLVSDAEIPWDRLEHFVRYWDMASTDRKDAEKRTAHTAGVLMARDKRTKVVYILDVRRAQYAPVNNRTFVRNTAQLDRQLYGDVQILMEQEPGSSGADSITGYAQELAGFKFEGHTPSGDKTKRAEPLGSYAKNSLVRCRKAAWNREFLGEVATYPISYKDQIDAAAGAFAYISSFKGFVFV